MIVRSHHERYDGCGYPARLTGERIPLHSRIMAIAVHPYLTGVPHRIGYFSKIFEYIKKHEGVVFMTGSEILDWYKQAAGYNK